MVILVSMIARRKCLDKTAQMDTCIITCVWCISCVDLINHTLSYYYIWNGCSDKTVQMENCIYMLVVHPVCGFNQTRFFILFYLYVSRNGFDETAHILTYTITS